jgi:hypothetical protein
MRRTKANYSKYLKAYLGINPETGEFGIAENQWNTAGHYYSNFLSHLESLKTLKTKGNNMTKKAATKTTTKKGTAKKRTKPSTKNTLKKATVKKSSVKMFVNEHEIPMLEILGKPRNTYISVKKAYAVLEAAKDESLVEVVEAHGRELNQVSYGDGKTFKVGDVKWNAVVENEAAILKAVS